MVLKTRGAFLLKTDTIDQGGASGTDAPAWRTPLRRAITELVAHYHTERNHQGIGNELNEQLNRTTAQGVVRRRPRMEGMLNFYYRAAA
jgi:hypothetical protein